MLNGRMRGVQPQRNLEETIPTDAEISDRSLIFMLLKFILPYWKQLLLVFFMLACITALSLLPPYLIQRAVDGPITQGDLNGLWPYTIIYFASIPLLFALRFFQIYTLQTVGQNALVSLRQTLFEHILRQDMRFFNKTPVGLLVARLSNDIEALTELLSTSIVIVITNLITLIGIVTVMVLLNWRLALLGLLVLPIMTVSTVYFRTKIRAASSRFHKLVGEYQAFLNEQMNGMLIVQLFGRQKQSLEAFDRVNRDYRAVHMQVRDQYTVFASILQILTTVGLALVLYGGGSGVLAGWATLGMLISFIQYTRRSFDPILALSEQFAQIQSALSAGERIARMLAVEPTIVDPEKPRTVQDQRQHSITLDHVDFSYEPGTPVLRDVCLHIPPGQRVAIVGATGAGKTSLAGLLTRFYDVQGGSVKIDGVDVRDMSLEDLRKCVMVVPQNPYCFNGTVADNLRLFDPTVTDDQMRVAAETARAAPFIERLPGEYDYKLLPGGANFSQGQRQLLALARALIHNPNSILVLDEATSNIDTETEAYIQEGLRHILHNRTSLIIAHRLSTIRDADRILVMNQGQIVEDGTHDDLLAKDGVYAQLYRRQFVDMVLPEQPEPELVLPDLNRVKLHNNGRRA
ncbi:MAG: ABC transporter ATP-binding protein [bacterium]|nr:ABC transporter ATP-binding protein [bacterium]